MAGRLLGWRALSWRERGQLAWMVVALPAIHLSLSLRGYVRTRAWVEHRSRRTTPRAATAHDMAAARTAARIASIAGRHGLVDATCLRQSLLLYWLLRRRGLQPQLQIGARKQEGAFDAHAWVELNGEPLQTSDVEHTPFPLHGRPS